MGKQNRERRAAKQRKRQRAQSDDLGVATVVGDPRDLALTELLVTSLLVQATRAMVDGGQQAATPATFVPAVVPDRLCHPHRGTLAKGQRHRDHDRAAAAAGAAPGPGRRE